MKQYILPSIIMAIGLFLVIWGCTKIHRQPKEFVPVEYFKNVDTLAPDYACPEYRIVTDAPGLNVAMGKIEQGIDTSDYGDAGYDSLFHEYTMLIHP